MEEMKAYLKALINDESGMELLQVAVVVLLSAALIAVVAWLFTSIGNKINEAAEEVNNANITPGATTSPWTTGGTPTS